MRMLVKHLKLFCLLDQAMQGLETGESGASAIADMAGAVFLVAEGENVMGRSILQS